jgi:hypothetical protein
MVDSGAVTTSTIRDQNGAVSIDKKVGLQWGFKECARFCQLLFDGAEGELEFIDKDVFPNAEVDYVYMVRTEDKSARPEKCRRRIRISLRFVPLPWRPHFESSRRRSSCSVLTIVVPGCKSSRSSCA